MTLARVGLIAALCVIATACGTGQPPAGQASPSRSASAPRQSSPCPAPQVPRSFPASPASDRNLVLGTLRGSDQTVVRDVTDIDHPSTVATVDLRSANLAAFVSASTISYANPWSRELVRWMLSSSGASVVAVACQPQSISKFAWSPDGQSITYLVDPQDPASALQWHLVTRGTDRVIGTAPTGCYCGRGSDDMSLAVGFSADGQFTWLVDDATGGSALQVRRLDGSLVGAEIRGDRSYTNPPRHGVWSGTDLFYRDNQGVKRWTNGTIKPFLPGVEWLLPRASPDGRQIVYSLRGSDSLSHLSVVDVASGRTNQVSSQPRSDPFFLSPRYIWSRGQRMCAASDQCMEVGGPMFSGTTYIIDLQTGTEWESIIVSIWDVWPHGS